MYSLAGFYARDNINIFLFIYPSICLFIYLFICLFIYLFIYPFTCRTCGKLTGLHLTVTPSSQQLVKECPPVYLPASRPRRVHSNGVTVAVLVYVNLINYMDRLTIAGSRLTV